MPIWYVTRTQGAGNNALTTTKNTRRQRARARQTTDAVTFEKSRWDWADGKLLSDICSLPQRSKGQRAVHPGSKKKLHRYYTPKQSEKQNVQRDAGYLSPRHI
jgi:hypothetical protein